MATSETIEYINEVWDNEVIPKLCEYIKIPNISPSFDEDWESNGHLNDAAQLLFNWAKDQPLKGATYNFYKDDGRTPLILIQVEGSSDCQSSILMYGHLDKQPPLDDWKEGLGPYTPVIRDGKLFGRGGADDGYSIFACVTSLIALQRQNIPHGPITICIEASEESGSCDLPYYLDKYSEIIGSPELVVCLDSGCGTYDQFWLTTTLRGLVVGNLRVDILEEGAHSGKASGIIPDSFRIISMILNRFENKQTGELAVPELYAELDDDIKQKAKACAEALGDSVYKEFTLVGDAKPITKDIPELLLNKTWRPTLTVTGADGLPSLKQGGNVLRSYTALKLSIRLPPTVNGKVAGQAVKKFLTQDPPFGSKVTFELEKSNSGWAAPPLEPWLSEAINESAKAVYGKPSNILGEGGSIHIMGMLGEKFPKAQFIVAGVLGPESNAHGPNEMMHIEMTKNVTSTIAGVVAKHYEHFKA